MIKLTDSVSSLKIPNTDLRCNSQFVNTHTVSPIYDNLLNLKNN